MIPTNSVHTADILKNVKLLGLVLLGIIEYAEGRTGESFARRKKRQGKFHSSITTETSHKIIVARIYSSLTTETSHRIIVARI